MMHRQISSRFIRIIKQCKMFEKLKNNQNNCRYLLDASLGFNLIVIMLGFLKYFEFILGKTAENVWEK